MTNFPECEAKRILERCAHRIAQRQQKKQQQQQHEEEEKEENKTEEAQH